MDIRRLLATIMMGFGLVVAIVFGSAIAKAASIDSGEPGVVRDVECGARWFNSCGGRFHPDGAGVSLHVAAERPVDSGDRGKLVSGPFGDSFYSDAVDRATFFVLPVSMVVIGAGLAVGGWVMMRKNRKRAPGG